MRHDDDDDAARARLEDLLLSLPDDRALPDLPDLLDRAGVPDELLHRDERILKVLQEAVLARPFSRVGDVQRVRTEVELLTLEVEVLADRLADDHTAPDVRDGATGRLAEVAARLAQIRGQL